MWGKCILRDPGKETPIHSSFFSTSLIPSNIPMDVETAAWTFFLKAGSAEVPTSQQTSYSHAKEGLVILRSKSNAPGNTEPWLLEYQDTET